MNTFSTRCRTHIDNVIALFRTGCLCHQHGADILHKDLSLEECIQCQDMIVIRNLQGIRKVWCLLYCHSLCFQACNNLLKRSLMRPAPHSDRSFCQKIFQDLLGCLHTVGSFPFFYKIFRHGIFHREITYLVFLSGWKFQFSYFPGNRAKYTVNKRFQIIKAFSLCQLYSLIAHSTVRNTVHKFQLIYRTS